MTTLSPPEQLPVGVGITGFTCGDETVDAWVRLHSATARRRGTAVIHVVRADERIIGFYTLSTHSIARAELDGGWMARNSPTQIPVILLGMMGVDEEFHGQGIGASLLRDAVVNSLKVACTAGAKALVVDPVDEEAAAFFSHFGFSPLPGLSRMFLKLV